VRILGIGDTLRIDLRRRRRRRRRRLASVARPWVIELDLLPLPTMGLMVPRWALQGLMQAIPPIAPGA